LPHPRSTTRMPWRCVEPDAAAKGISSISDLASKVREGDELRLACTVEFVTRADALKPLEQTYGFQFGFRAKRKGRPKPPDIRARSRPPSHQAIGRLLRSWAKVCPVMSEAPP
jgi:hypothetical protein